MYLRANVMYLYMSVFRHDVKKEDELAPFELVESAALISHYWVSQMASAARTIYVIILSSIMEWVVSCHVISRPKRTKWWCTYGMNAVHLCYIFSTILESVICVPSFSQKVGQILADFSLPRSKYTSGYGGVRKKMVSLTLGLPIFLFRANFF